MSIDEKTLTTVKQQSGKAVQLRFGFVIPADIQAAILAVLNVILRFDTSQPISVNQSVGVE